MGLFSKKIKSIFKRQNRKVQSKVIYNTKFNVIILIQYYDANLYSAMQFLNNANKVGLTTLISHYAEVNKEDEEVNNSEGKIKINIPIEYINQKYYMLISGTPEQYAELYKYLDLSNTLLDSITLEIYNNISSTPFDEIITTGVLIEDEFKFSKRAAEYDKLVHAPNKLKDFDIHYDDFNLIMSRIPNTFEAISVVGLIHIYETEPDLINGTYENPIEIVKKMFEATNHYDNHEGQETYFLNRELILALSQLYDAIAPELIDTNNIDTLYTLIAPIYMIEEFEDDVLSTGEVSPEKLDDIFQQEYDRFTNPLADSDILYVNVDEKIDGTSDRFIIPKDTREEESNKEDE